MSDDHTYQWIRYHPYSSRTMWSYRELRIRSPNGTLDEVQEFADRVERQYPGAGETVEAIDRPSDEFLINRMRNTRMAMRMANERLDRFQRLLDGAEPDTPRSPRKKGRRMELDNHE